MELFTRLFVAYVAAGEQAFLENRPAPAATRVLSPIRRHDASELSAADGQEAPGLTGDGGEILPGRAARP
jgi:hypothetical protein